MPSPSHVILDRKHCDIRIASHYNNNINAKCALESCQLEFFTGDMAQNDIKEFDRDVNCHPAALISCLRESLLNPIHMTVFSLEIGSWRTTGS